MLIPLEQPKRDVQMSLEGALQRCYAAQYNNLATYERFVADVSLSLLSARKHNRQADMLWRQLDEEVYPILADIRSRTKSFERKSRSAGRGVRFDTAESIWRDQQGSAGVKAWIKLLKELNKLFEETIGLVRQLPEKNSNLTNAGMKGFEKAKEKIVTDIEWAEQWLRSHK